MIKTFFRLFGLILIFCSFSLGQTWYSPHRVTYTSTPSRLPEIAVDSANTIHIVWMDNSPGNYEIYYKKCTSGGAGTWSLVKRLTWTDTNSEYPFVAVSSDDTVHVVWCEFVDYTQWDLYYKSSSDGGATWGGTTRLTWSSGNSMYPVLVPVGCGDLRVFFEDDKSGNSEIYFVSRSCGSWGGLNRLTWTSGDSRNLYAALDNSSDLHLIWSEMIDSDYELCHRKSTDYGLIWSGRTRVTYSSSHSQDPSFDFDPVDNTMRLAWSEGGCGDRRVCFKNRNPSTNAFYGYKRLTYVTGECCFPTVAASTSNYIHIVYEGDSPGNYELYHKKSSNGGVNWTAPFRLSWTSGSSRSPKMVASGALVGLRLVYNDYTPGNAEIYFKRADLIIK